MADFGGSNSSSTIHIINSTINDNMAKEQGGGIEVRGLTMTVINSTVSGNKGRVGGGIRSVGHAEVKIYNSTISGNIAVPPFGSGGGIRVDLATATVTMKHTIVAGNISEDFRGADCVVIDSMFISLGNNLVGEGTGCPSDGIGDLTVDPDDVFTTVLGPLKNNGGPTMTHALLLAALRLMPATPPPARPPTSGARCGRRMATATATPSVISGRMNIRPA